MNTRFSKWGNSLAIRIPASFAQEISVGEGAIGDLSVENGCLIVRPLTEPRYNLAELLSRISESNLHGEVESNSAVGNEFF